AAQGFLAAHGLAGQGFFAAHGLAAASAGVTMGAAAERARAKSAPSERVKVRRNMIISPP
ncbi:MAG TPA: hypothetical protein DDZ83_14895, partial [Nitrospinae bacterium]|nr:hypothetical protein [Nitrospinota bacterium]